MVNEGSRCLSGPIVFGTFLCRVTLAGSDAGNGWLRGRVCQLTAVNTELSEKLLPIDSCQPDPLPQFPESTLLESCSRHGRLYRLEVLLDLFGGTLLANNGVAPTPAALRHEDAAAAYVAQPKPIRSVGRPMAILRKQSRARPSIGLASDRGSGENRGYAESY